MSFLDRLFSWNGARSAPAEARPQDSYASTTVTRGSTAWGEMFGPATSAPLPTESTAFTVSAIYACVNLIAGAISGLPMHIYRVSPDGERDRTQTDPLWWVLNEEMTPRWSAANAWEFLVQSMLLHGDAFAVIMRGANSMPTGIKPIHPQFVEVTVNPVTDRLVYAVEPDPAISGGKGKRVVYDQDDILHVAGFGFDGVRGSSPLRYSLRSAASIAMAAQEFSSSFYANSARPDYALKTDGKLSSEAIENLRAQIEERHMGAGKAFRPMVLQGGLQVQTITMPMKDMELIATRQFQIEEIARIYGVPPFMIGYNEKTTSWGSGVEAMGIGFVRFTLRQHLNKFETEFNRKLFRTASKRVEFDTFDLERADMKSMFESFRTALGRAGEPGWMTDREIRMRLNLKREPDGTLNPGVTSNEPAPQPPAP